MQTGEHFGIVSNIDSNFSKVGCTAIIEKITTSYPDGSFDILVTGIERFKTHSTILSSDGYLEADVSKYGDKTIHEFDEILYNKTTNKLLEVLRIADVELEHEFWANLTVAEIKSFKIAEKAGLNLKQRQKILSLQNEKERLSYILEHLKKIATLIGENKIVQELIAGDGYLNK